MEQDTTGEWKDYLAQFRLQSARSKERKRREGFEKQLLKIHRERAELQQQQRNLGWIPLDPPVMRGWKRFFVLREDQARSKHAAFFQRILDKINTVQHSDKKSFTAKKRKWGRKVQVERDQKLLQPDEFHFRRLGFTEREMQFFYEVVEKDKASRWVKRYRFVEPWRFVLRVRPNMITKVRARDEVIEKRLKEINQYLQQRDLEGRLDHLLYGGQQYRWKFDDRKKDKYRFKQKSLNSLLDRLQDGALA